LPNTGSYQTVPYFAIVYRTDIWNSEDVNVFKIFHSTPSQGCSPKKEVGGRLKQDLDNDLSLT